MIEKYSYKVDIFSHLLWWWYPNSETFDLELCWNCDIM